MFDFYRANGRKNCPAIITVPSTASTTYHVGDALVLSSGAAVKATGTTKPTHICAAEYVAPATGNADIAVYPILDGYEWKVPASTSIAAVAVGAKVTIHTDAAQITATTSSGVAEIVAKLGTQEAIVKF